MTHPVELLPNIRDLFDPRNPRAIGVAVAEAIRSAGGLDALASGLEVYSFHPDFEDVSKTQIAALEAISPESQAAHVSFGSGSVDWHVSVMCEQHGVEPASIPALLDAEEASAIAPTFFHNDSLGRVMLTGHLTVVQLPGLRLVS